MEQTTEKFCGLIQKIDRYNGVRIDFLDLIDSKTTTANNNINNTNNVNKINKSNDELSISEEKFDEELKNSLIKWTKCGRRCIWFCIPTKFSKFIPILTKHGFDFHHARSKYVMLLKWISPNEPMMAPIFAHTTIGVGGLVYNPDAKKVLLIQEKNPRVKMWKFPGGYSEPKEDISETAIREVLEETGVKCSFKSLISFRHRHDGIFDCSDFYFVCVLVPLEKFDNIKMCQFEIDDCKWFDLDEARKELCGFNIYVFEEFLKQYSLLEFSKSNIDSNPKGHTVGSEIIRSKYGPYERIEKVYTVRSTSNLPN